MATDPTAAGFADPTPGADPAVRIVQLGQRMRDAQGDPRRWTETIRACADWLRCPGLLSHPDQIVRPGPRPLAADDLEGMAGRIALCAGLGRGACSAMQRPRCMALGSLLSAVAQGRRQELQSQLFDCLPPSWILDRAACVLMANRSARAITDQGEPLCLRDGRLDLAGLGAGGRLLRHVGDLKAESLLHWPLRKGCDRTLHLQVLDQGRSVGATLLPLPLDAVQLAQGLTTLLGVTAAQARLAALLLEGQSPTAAAAALGVSRQAVYDRLARLMQRVGVNDRKALQAALIAAAAAASALLPLDGVPSAALTAAERSAP